MGNKTEYSDKEVFVYGSTLETNQWDYVEYRTGGHVEDTECDQLGIIENPSFGIPKDKVAIEPELSPESPQPGTYTEPQNVTLGNPGETFDYQIIPENN